jgi:hypothetical protein
VTDNAPRRLSELTGGMGEKLEAIKGSEVVVAAIEFETRPVHKLDPKTGAQLDELEDKEFALITTEDGHRYYTLSAPLIVKLKGVDPEELPAVATFDLKDIPGGRRVWTIS